MDRQRRARIWGLALPIIGGMISQNVLNLVDTYMVGQLRTEGALAAVGLGGFANFLFQSLLLGVSVGVQAMAARRKGEGMLDETAHALNTGLVLVLTLGLVFSAVLYFLVPAIYPLLNSDPRVIEPGVPYLQVRVLAIAFVGMNFSFRGYWNAVDLSRLYMSTLITMHVANIILNYILIFGNFGAPALGVEGAAWGTSLSTVLGTCVYFFLGFKYAMNNGFLHSWPTWAEIKGMVRLSLPNSIQQLFFSGGFTMMFWIIGKVGVVELDAANVLINLTLVAILPAIALGIAAATLVGQALGRKDPDDAKQWGYDVAKLGSIYIGILGVLLALFPDPILGLFIHDAETMAVARWPLRIVGLSMWLDAAGLIMMNALLGAGATQKVMRVSIGMQWLLFLPAAYVAGPVLGMGLLTIWLMQGAYRVAQGFVFLHIWRKGEWTDIKI